MENIEIERWMMGGVTDGVMREVPLGQADRA